MSTLEQLKKQASEATLQNKVVTSTETPADTDTQWRKLAPVMKYLQNHFNELAGSLNVLAKGIPVDFKISDSVILRGLKGRNYKITHPSADKEKAFVFEFENTGDNPGFASIPVGSPTTVFKDTLNKNQIKFSANSVDAKSTKFEIQPLVRTKYQFIADVEKECISLTITNYKDLWARTNHFKKNGITTELMDELTKHVLREPNKYDEMVGNVISESERTLIRERLKEITATQLGADKAPVTPPQETAKQEKSLFGKLFGKH